MKKLALIAFAAIATAAMAQTTAPGNTTTSSGKMAQEANAAKSGTKAADSGQANADAKGAQSGTSGTASMGATGTAATGSTTAATGTKPSRWAAMDTNKDGMISQEEYMAFHTARWGKMKQTNGMVTMQDMETMMAGGPN